MKSNCLLIYLSFVHLINSQFEEKFEEIHGVEAPPDVPSSSGFHENTATAIMTDDSREKLEMEGQDMHQTFSDVNSSQDFVSGIMKIVPSEIDVSLVSTLYNLLITKI